MIRGVPIDLATNPGLDGAVLDAAVLAGESAATDLIRRSIAALSPLGTHVLLTGERGTGRRTCATLLHAQSSHRDRPFVSVSLTAATASRAAAPMFGLRGLADLAAEARGVTLYIDGFEHLPLDLHDALGRMLMRDESSGIRVLAATTRSLAPLVFRGHFSRALATRVGLLQITIPPLRERPSDIAPVARHALRTWNERHPNQPRRFGDGALAALEAHTWPGNVAELVALVHGTCAATRARTLTAERMRMALGRRPHRAVAADVLPLRDVEREYIETVVARSGGNRSLAAKRLGIGRNTLARRLHDVQRHRLRAAS